jgi:anti-repressor protein
MIDALAVTTTDETKQGIDARRLHGLLSIGRDFSNWMRDQVSRFELVQGRDFKVFSISGGNPQGGRPATEYLLSIGAAKLIALSQNSDAAKAARAALIAIEERWNSPASVMARALQMAAAQRAKDERMIAELMGKAEAHDRLSAAHGDVCLQDAGRILRRQPNLFVAQLIEDGILFRSSHDKPVPMVAYREYFRVRITESNGETYTQTLVTPRGLQWLAGKYLPDMPVLGRARVAPVSVTHG